MIHPFVNRVLLVMSTHNRFTTLNTKFQKGDKGDIANAKMYTFLEQILVERRFFACVNDHAD